MVTDGKEAHGYLLGFAPLSMYGACWHYVWRAYAMAGAETNMGASPNAYTGWNLTQGKHWGDFNPPHGAAIWLGRRYSDGNMDGDVFIAGEFDGDHAATDQPTYGRTGRTSIRDRMDLCDREYLGWTDHVLDVPINLGGNTPTPGIPTYYAEDEMAFIANVSDGDIQGQFLIVPNGGGKHFALGLGGGANHDGLPTVDINNFAAAWWQTVQLV